MASPPSAVRRSNRVFPSTPLTAFPEVLDPLKQIEIVRPDGQKDADVLAAIGERKQQLDERRAEGVGRLR